jgi:malic enzyme
VTDNESILGIGDQGAGGIAISIGKLSLYTAGAGIDPATVLPVSLDVGTDNQALLEDPFYLGWPHRRLRGAPYQAILDEFVAAVAEVFPGALVQWEDFRKDNALRVLDRYRDVLPSFNDDIQGTGAVALAGVLTSERLSGRRLGEERVVIVGGGAAGLGIARQIGAAMAADGASPAVAGWPIAVLDSKGLIVEAGTDSYKRELAWSTAQADALGLGADRSLAAVTERFRPTVLIGTSGQRGAFTREIVETMARFVERPLILPLSNPTPSCEVAPQDVYAWTRARALVATGSPFPDADYGGRRYRVGQGNNAFIFPGVGAALIAAGLSSVPDLVFDAAARALAQSVSQEELESGLLYPPISRIRSVSRIVARAVLTSLPMPDGECYSEDAAEQLLDALTWEPEYPDYQPG